MTSLLIAAALALNVQTIDLPPLAAPDANAQAQGMAAEQQLHSKLRDVPATTPVPNRTQPSLRLYRGF